MYTSESGMETFVHNLNSNDVVIFDENILFGHLFPYYIITDSSNSSVTSLGIVKDFTFKQEKNIQ